MDELAEASGTGNSGQAAAPGAVAAEGPAPRWRRILAAARSFFDFVDDGCRTEIRIGILLVLMAVFLWLWLGPATSSMLYLAGLPLLVVGVPLQALEARRRARPGFPWKLGIALSVGGTLMLPGVVYREAVGGPLQVQPVAPMLIVVGAWILLWWPMALRRPLGASAPASASGARP